MFHENLKKARLVKGFSALQVANFLSITRRSYYFFESGQRSPSLSLLAALSVVLGVSVDDLLSSEISSFRSHFSFTELE